MSFNLWKNNLKAVSFENKNSSYYSHLPIKPKFYFYSSLNLSTYPIDALQIIVPETFISSEGSNLLFYSYLTEILKKKD